MSKGLRVPLSCQRAWNRVSHKPNSCAPHHLPSPYPPPGLCPRPKGRSSGGALPARIAGSWQLWSGDRVENRASPRVPPLPLAFFRHSCLRLGVRHRRSDPVGHSWWLCDPGPVISPLKLPDPYLPVKTYLGPPRRGAGQTRKDRHPRDTDHPQPFTVSRLQERALATKLDLRTEGRERGQSTSCLFIPPSKASAAGKGRRRRGWKEENAGTSPLPPGSFS